MTFIDQSPTMTVFGIMFKQGGTCERVCLPETIGELVVWYKKNAISCNELDLVNLDRKIFSNVNNGLFEYTSCICDSGTKDSLGDIVVFRTIIPVYTFQTMEERVYSIETDYSALKKSVDEFRELGLRVM